eukprot:4247472-Amphidinium_carterae.1
MFPTCTSDTKKGWDTCQACNSAKKLAKGLAQEEYSSLNQRLSQATMNKTDVATQTLSNLEMTWDPP